MLRYAFNSVKQLAVVEYSGEIDYATMLRYMTTIWEDPDCNSQYSAICDFSQVQLKMSSNDVKEIFYCIMMDERSLKGRCALVISTPLETALGFIFKHIAQQEQLTDAPQLSIQIFHEWENACAFVNCSAKKESFDWKTVE